MFFCFYSAIFKLTSVRFQTFAYNSTTVRSSCCNVICDILSPEIFWGDPPGQGCRNPGEWGIYPHNKFLTMVCIWALDDVWIFFFLVFTWFWGQKQFNFRWRLFFEVDKNSSIFGEDLLLRWTKTLQFSVKIFFFFGLHLICSREKNCCRALFPPMLKIGKIGVKLQIISSMLNINRHHCPP